MSGVSIRLYWWQSLGIVIGSVIALYTNSSVAQITPDGTLPNNSNVRLDGNTRIISGGTTRGANLFHSFQEFSVPNGSTAFFNNALNIQNILTRVTGKSISNIDGLIRANGTANLFLINPNGIIFGQNAQLDIGGSFFATSANSIKFADGFEFSANNPQPTPLLTISVPIGLQFGANPGLIQVQGNGQGARNVDSPIIDTLDALRVQPDKTLALVGGDVYLEGATLKTAGGRIELGSVAPNGLVSLTPTNFGFALGYGGVQNFGNIQLSQQATVDASGEGGGDIQVQGRRVTVTNNSQIETSTLGSKQGGDLVVNATESVDASGRYSNLSAFVYPKGTGNAGNLTINTRELLIRDGAQVSTATVGAGKGGNLAVTADSVQVVGRSRAGRSSNLAAQSRAIGNAGNLTINTRELLIRDGADVNTNTSSAGKGGNLAVTADSVQVIGSSDGRFSNLGPQSLGIGNAGNLTINTRELLIRDGAFVNTGTFGAGKGGNLAVTADSVQVIGDLSILTSEADKGSTGDAGDLRINTRELLIRDGANVTASTFGAGKGGNLAITADSVQVIGSSSDNISFLFAGADRGSTGNGGDLRINTRELLVRDGAQVATGTFGAGKGGNLVVTADSVQVIDRADNGSTSFLTSKAYSGSTGNAGDLTINTRELLIRDGANVSASTSGAGKGGNLAVTADNVQVLGSSSDTRYVSFLSAGTERGSTGDAGDLTINTRELLIRDGAQVATGTFGAGKGGNLVVTADSVQVVGTTTDGRSSSGLFASSSESEKAKAGDINIDANSIVLNNAAKINADTNGGGGNIFVNSPLLQLRRGSSITTNASGDNITGGNITIDAKNGFIVAVPSENSDIRADSANFRGGNVTIKNTAGIFGIQSRKEPSPQTSDITAKGVTPDLSGNVQITTPDIDPTNGLIELPTNLVDVSGQISTACTPGSRQSQSSFVSTGRGGLPMSPTEPLQDTSTLSAWVRLRPKPANSAKTTISPQPTAVSNSTKVAAATTIVEATGWVVDSNGNIELVAQAPGVTPHSSWQTPASCQNSK